MHPNSSPLAYSEKFIRAELAGSAFLHFVRDARAQLVRRLPDDSSPGHLCRDRPLTNAPGPNQGETVKALQRIPGFVGKRGTGAAFRQYKKEEHLWALSMVSSRIHALRVQDFNDGQCKANDSQTPAPTLLPLPLPSTSCPAAPRRVSKRAAVPLTAAAVLQGTLLGAWSRVPTCSTQATMCNSMWTVPPMPPRPLSSAGPPPP